MTDLLSAPWQDLALVAAGTIGVIVAIAHGFAMHRVIVRPLRKLIDTNRAISPVAARLVTPLLHVSTFTWLVGGLTLIVAGARLQGEGRLVVCSLVASIYLYAAAMNAWASRGRHIGWVLMAVALIMLAAGANKP